MIAPNLALTIELVYGLPKDHYIVNERELFQGDFVLRGVHSHNPITHAYLRSSFFIYFHLLGVYHKTKLLTVIAIALIKTVHSMAMNSANPFSPNEIDWSSMSYEYNVSLFYSPILMPARLSFALLVCLS